MPTFANANTRAKITAQAGFSCAPQGHTVINFPHGTEVTGQVAEWALAAHKAARMFDPRDTRDTIAEQPVLEKKKRGKYKKGRT